MPKGESIFAAKSVIGSRYVTKGGYPVTIVEVNEKGIKVLNDLNGRSVTIDHQQLLWPYKPESVSGEAKRLAATVRTSGKKVEKRVQKLTQKSLERSYKGSIYRVEVKPDGFRRARGNRKDRWDRGPQGGVARDLQDHRRACQLHRAQGEGIHTG